MGFYGLQHYDTGAPMPRHRHAEPYMAIVVEGGYREAGDSGRADAGPGDVLLHAAFDAHRDEFHRRGAVVLNLPFNSIGESGFARIDDVDAIVRLAESDPWLAARQAELAMGPGKRLLDDWPDLLAQALCNDPGLPIAGWADQMGLAVASVSRGFSRAYGVTPKRFRLEARARVAARRLPIWTGGLAALAAELGFADQAHMSRAIAAVTGQTPARLRAKSVQAQVPSTR